MGLRGLVAGVVMGLTALPAVGADIGLLYPALEAGDTGVVTRFVETYYRDAGISINEGLDWESQSFDKIVNWYNDFTETILLADLPTRAQVPAYWQNWSEVLTGGRWDWRAFFATPDEAALMANFNQFLVAAHEYGHALTYRYDPDFNARWDQEVNCREYAADRLATTLLDEIAAVDARLAGLRTRYRALIAELNGLVPERDRYTDVTLAQLTEDCRVMRVEQPTEDTMTPYVSAFFVRQGLLLAADLPPLADLYAAELLPRLRERQLPPSGLAGPVQTVGPVEVDFSVAETGLEIERRVPAFDPDGRLYVLEYGFDGEDRLDARFAFGPAGGKVEEIFPLQKVQSVRSTGDLMAIGSVVVLGPDHVVAAQLGLGFEGDEALLFDLRRGADGTWALRTLDVAPPGGFAGLDVASDPSGGVTAFVEPIDEDGTAMTRLTVDPETFTVAGTEKLPHALGTAIAVGADGTAYFDGDNVIAVAGPDGTARAVAGSGLQGFKDAADPLAAEFIVPDTGVVLDGRLLVLDYDPASRAWVKRTIALRK